MFSFNAFKVITCLHLLYFPAAELVEVTDFTIKTSTPAFLHTIFRVVSLQVAHTLSDHNETMMHLPHPRSALSKRKTTSPGFFMCLCIGFCRHDGSGLKGKQAVRGVRWTFFISTGLFH